MHQFPGKKQTFQTVPVSDIAHLADREAQDFSLSSTSPATILSISYDRDLLFTREMILARAGYRVYSVLQFKEALDLCAQKTFDLVIIGHSIPDDDKRMFLAEIRGRGAMPILAFRRIVDRRLEGMDFELDPAEGPEVLLAKVTAILSLRPPK